MQQLQLAQLKARQNFNPMQYLLSQQAAQQPQQAAGPATQAALAGQQGASNAQQIAGNTTTPYQAPPGAIGNVDMAGLLSGAAKAGMSPEEAQQMAGVIDPMTAIRMKLMSQPAVSVAPGASLVSPGLAQIQAMQNPQGGGAGGAQPAAGNAGAGQPSVLGAPGAQPGALFTNTNLPPDSQAAQVMNLTRARDMYAPNGPTPDPAKFASLDAALTKATGAQEQSLAQQKQNIENVKTYGDPALYEPYAQAVAKGQMPPPSNRTQTPATQAFQARVLQINPNYDAKDYEAKQQAVNSFASGPHGDILRSQAVAINHLGQLNTLVDALGNGNMPIVNQVANEWAKQNGGTAPTNFDAAKPIVTDEVMKAVLGAGGALGDRDTAQKALDSALTTPQLKGVLNQYTGLLYGQRQGLAQQYQTATGRTDFESRFPIIGSSSQAQTPSAANPASNFSQADRLAEARRRGLIK
ncbi:hypothetical protein [Caballeronia udeis]|nr:hypothetical protein [Caballeronia udeis]